MSTRPDDQWSERLSGPTHPTEPQHGRVTRATIEDAVMKVGAGILVAVVVLILLGQVYATNIVAEPHELHDPTATVTNEGQPGGTGLKTLNVTTADWYYDNGTNAETVTNQTSGATLTEGTDYEFYTNGTIEVLAAAGSDNINVTYSYYTQNGFQAMTSTFADYGTTALTMIGIGLIALGASVALMYFGGFGRGGGR